MNRILQWLTSSPAQAPHVARKVLDPYDLETPLCYLSGDPRDALTIRNACEGIQIWGQSGSGKSTGSGRHLALALLRSGAGGIVFCVKGDEPRVWRDYCARTGRLGDLVVFAPDQPWRFNPLEYQYRRAGSGHITENIVNLFASLAEVVDRSTGTGANDYWSRAMKQLVRNAADLAAIARGIPTLDLICQIIGTAPQSPEEARATTWQRSSVCHQCILQGEKRPKTPIQQGDWPQVVRFWLHEFPTLSDRTRSCIVSTFTVIADTFVRGELRKLFGTTTNITPEDSFDGKILLLSIPIKTHGELGRLSQVLWKYLWQQAAEGRDVHRNPRHVFMWADEAQHFLSRADPLFLTTSRSAKVVTVLLTQNVPNYNSVLSRAETDALLANLACKIWHRNSCTVTNTLAADTIARSRVFRWSTGIATRDAGDASRNIGGSEGIEWAVIPGDFQYLKCGGPPDCEVEGIAYQSGRVWAASGTNYLRVCFNQNAYA
ncbi:MAG: type IV secretory system conjugative DNA transfer family protein [Verrucomicrobia bacterium]|nr:type IV secretory system conjugative DNA transfer family protein [Verrucomicrobiota bacterium]